MKNVTFQFSHHVLFLKCEHLWFLKPHTHFRILLLLTYPRPTSTPLAISKWDGAGKKVEGDRQTEANLATIGQFTGREETERQGEGGMFPCPRRRLWSVGILWFYGAAATFAPHLKPVESTYPTPKITMIFVQFLSSIKYESLPKQILKAWY